MRPAFPWPLLLPVLLQTACTVTPWTDDCRFFRQIVDVHTVGPDHPLAHLKQLEGTRTVVGQVWDGSSLPLTVTVDVDLSSVAYSVGRTDNPDIAEVCRSREWIELDVTFTSTLGDAPSITQTMDLFVMDDGLHMSLWMRDEQHAQVSLPADDALLRDRLDLRVVWGTDDTLTGALTAQRTPEDSDAGLYETGANARTVELVVF